MLGKDPGDDTRPLAVFDEVAFVLDVHNIPDKITPQAHLERARSAPRTASHTDVSNGFN